MFHCLIGRISSHKCHLRIDEAWYIKSVDKADNLSHCSWVIKLNCLSPTSDLSSWNFFFLIWFSNSRLRLWVTWPDGLDPWYPWRSCGADLNDNGFLESCVKRNRWAFEVMKAHTSIFQALKFVHPTNSYLSTYYLLDQGLVIYGLQAKSRPMPGFVNKLLLELSHSHLLPRWLSGKESACP